MKQLCCLLLGGVMTLSSLNAGASSYAELAYSRLSIDYKPFPDANGVRALAQLGIGERIEAYGSYNSAEFRPSGPELGQYALASDWADLGARIALLRGETLRLALGASSQSVELDSDRKYGHALHANLRWTPSARLQLELDLAQMDLVIDDIRASAALALHLSESLSLTTRIIDHSDWDLTFYEAGLRWNFGAALTAQ